MEFQSSLLSLLIILLLTIFFTVLKILVLKRSPLEASQKLPPGPLKLPLIGNLHNLGLKGATLPHRRLAELARVYGPIMHLQLGEVPTVVVSSADMAREVMKTHDSAFCDRPKLLIGIELGYNCSNIGLAPYSEYWRQLKKIATLELFTLNRIESFRALREEETSNLIDSISSEAGSVVNLTKKLFDLTSVITTRTTIRTTLKEELEILRVLVAQVMEISSGFSVVDLYPSIKWLYSISGVRRKMEGLIREANRLIDPIIEERKCKIRQGNNNVEQDFLDVLMKFHQDYVNKEDDFSLTTNNIKAILTEIYGAGSETSSTVMEWAMAEMLRNPRVMRKAQDEVRQVYKAHQGIFDHTKLDDELKYLKLVIKETLRLHPPFTLLVPRVSMDKCQIQGYEIPSKTRVLINAWAIGRDPKYWFNPNEFIPERFEQSSVDYKGANFEFIPFGAGKRRCPGISLGIANVFFPLAKLLYHFDWKLSNLKRSEELDMNESFGLTTTKKSELFVIPIPYS